MSVVSPLFVISFDEHESSNLRNLVVALGYPETPIIVGGVSEAVAALNARTRSPDYLIIDIGQQGREVFPALDEIAQHCDARVRAVVIGSVNDITFYREMRARGVVEYCARPVQAEDLRAVLMQAPAEPVSVRTNSGQKGTVISCMSAASGDGASTLAVNLAYCLAEEFNQPTVIIDLDYQFGLIAKSLDLTAPFGIRELFDYPERGLDDLLVEKMLVKYGRNLSIIASPHELRQMPVITPEIIHDLIAVLRTKFRFIIIDIPHVWTQWTAAAVTYSDHVIMVGQLWLRSLTHASRLMSAWQAMGIADSAISLVINRSGAKFKEAITVQDFERICRHKVEAHLNNNVKAIVSAETQGKTLFESGQDPVLQQQIRQFAQAVYTRATHSAAPDIGVSSQGGKKGLFTLLGKKNG